MGPHVLEDPRSKLMGLSGQTVSRGREAGFGRRGTCLEDSGRFAIVMWLST